MVESVALVSEIVLDSVSPVVATVVLLADVAAEVEAELDADVDADEVPDAVAEPVPPELSPESALPSEPPVSPHAADMLVPIIAAHAIQLETLRPTQRLIHTIDQNLARIRGAVKRQGRCVNPRRACAIHRRRRRRNHRAADMNPAQAAPRSGVEAWRPQAQPA